MKPAPFRYVRAFTADEALVALAEDPEARVLAGGQSLIALMNLRVAKPTCLVDINRVDELDYIREDGEVLAIGAMTRHATVRRSPLVASHCPLLHEAYDQIAHHTVHNRGTLGGNLCHADPASEAAAVALASDANLVLRSRSGERTVAASGFFVGLYETAVSQNEMLTEIRIPKRPAGEGWAFEEVSPRKGDFAVTAIAAKLRLADGVCASARIAGAAIADRALRLEPAEEALAGRPVNDETIASAARAARDIVDPPSDYHADSDYRRDLVYALTARALKRSLARCG